METYKEGIAIHIEPQSPIELPQLLSSLNSFGDEYSSYTKDILGLKGNNASRLYVGSVKPGSIDIFLHPEILDVAYLGLSIGMASGPADAVNIVWEFGRRLRLLLEKFETKPNFEDVSIRDCDNAVNISNNIVQSGGQQIINYLNISGKAEPIYNMDGKKAHTIVNNANETKAQLQFPATEKKNSTAMVWKRVDRSPAKNVGSRSLDKAIIEEIDPSAKSVLFGDNLVGLKEDILHSDQNPMTMIYYVDVEIIRVAQKITAYRVIGFHGKDTLENNQPLMF